MGDLCQRLSVCTDDHRVDARTVPDAGTAPGELEKDRAEHQSDRDPCGTGVFPVQHPSAEDSRFYDFLPCWHDRSDQYGDDRHAFSGCGLETGLWKTENLWDCIFENDRGAGDHYPVPETGSTANPDGECKNDPVDQPAGSNCPDSGNDHTDGTALQEGCGICKFDQCIYHVGVHRDDAADGDVVYDVKRICIKSDGERNYAD